MDQRAHPEPLPPSKHTGDEAILTSSQNIYQGKRKKGDFRVYNYKFDYEAKPVGHQMSCQGRFNCFISHMAVETEGGIPMLIRGGAGYRYFFVVAKAKPGVQLTGRVRAYCRLQTDDPKL